LSFWGDRPVLRFWGGLFVIFGRFCERGVATGPPCSASPSCGRPSLADSTISSTFRRKSSSPLMSRSSLITLAAIQLSRGNSMSPGMRRAAAKSWSGSTLRAPATCQIFASGGGAWCPVSSWDMYGADRPMCWANFRSETPRSCLSCLSASPKLAHRAFSCDVVFNTKPYTWCWCLQCC